MNDNILSFDRDPNPEPHWGAGRGEPGFDDYPYGEPDDRHYGGPGNSNLGDLLHLVVIDNEVVNVRKRPVEGSGFEHTARELGRGRPVVPPTPPPPPTPAKHEQILSWLSLLVGGEDRLTALDAHALPHEEIDLSRVPPELRERVARIDHELTRVSELLFGTEVLTASRRLLATAVAAQPALLRGSLPDEAMACATLTAAAKANDLVGQGRIVPTTLLRTLFNLRSAPHDKVQAVARAVAPQTPLLRGWDRLQLDVLVLGSGNYLVGSFREAIVSTRDAALHLRAMTPEQPVATDG
ncbi:hypothetical protein N802_08885 [Knoellia sinensis KCTC 19936]|uniref:Uncharacterized protein n=1 Tax=Knoellia sinensis KCTC 19936 TaxID=1385520 RepID=A0A0A0JB28_9MICO|nr:hypothetical protein [Knoellia sinensis]KGN33984.1 hypothetical protein N802_08885 [Knoellia sinensis KCTC 19936]